MAEDVVVVITGIFGLIGTIITAYYNKPNDLPINAVTKIEDTENSNTSQNKIVSSDNKSLAKKEQLVKDISTGNDSKVTIKQKSKEQDISRQTVQTIKTQDNSPVEIVQE